MADENPPIMAWASGPAGSLYEQSLVGMVAVLDVAGVTHWRQSVARDLQAWEDSRSTEHHRSTYGGNGSLSDLSLRGLVGTIDQFEWLDAALGPLRLIASTSAPRAATDANQFIQVRPGSIPRAVYGLGAYRCGSCELRFTAATDIASAASTAWSSWVVPRLISSGEGSATASVALGSEDPQGRDPYISHVVDVARQRGIQQVDVIRYRDTPCPSCGAIAWTMAGVSTF